MQAYFGRICTIQGRVALPNDHQMHVVPRKRPYGICERDSSVDLADYEFNGLLGNLMFLLENFNTLVGYPFVL